jgi:hypothetical protein
MNSEAKVKGVPPNATTTEAEGETILKVPPKELNLSKEAHPFPCSKAGMQPCMSFVSFTEDPVLRSKEAESLNQTACPGYVRSPIIDADAIQRIGGHRIRYSDADARFWQTVCVNARKEAVSYLSLLIKNDQGIDVEGSRILCQALNVISRAGVPT